MFDTYQVGPRSIDAHVSVTEKRAPTDESVRLLREMEDKAEREVLKAIRLEGNAFKGVMHQMYDPMTDEDRYAVIFELNGNRHKVIEARKRHENMDEFVTRLRDAVAAEIAHIVIVDCAITLGKQP